MTTKTAVPLLKAALRLTDKFKSAFKAMEAIVYHTRVRVRETIANQQMISNLTGESGRILGNQTSNCVERRTLIQFGLNHKSDLAKLSDS